MSRFLFDLAPPVPLRLSFIRVILSTQPFSVEKAQGTVLCVLKCAMISAQRTVPCVLCSDESDESLVINVEGSGNAVKKRESIFLNERFMMACCIVVLVSGLVSLYFCLREGETFELFELLTKLVTAAAMYQAFRFYKWDVVKGLMGGVLFCLMYQEAYLVLARLWGESDFDAYLVAGVQGSLYLASAGMTFLMTVIITVNHFFINYSSHGNPKNVILNRMALIVKFAVYLLLFAANSQLGFSSFVLWKNALRYLTDIAVLLLLVSVESQFDSFNVLRRELWTDKRERGKDK